MSGLASLKSRIHTIEALPGTMKTPAKNLAQESEQTGQIGRLNDLTLKANTNLLETEAEHGNDTELPEAHQDTYREWPPTPVAGEGTTEFEFDTKNQQTPLYHFLDQPLPDYPATVRSRCAPLSLTDHPARATSPTS